MRSNQLRLRMLIGLIAVAVIVAIVVSVTVHSSPHSFGLIISPLPGTPDASATTQVSLLGIAPTEVKSVSVVGSKSGVHTGRLQGYSDGNGESFLPTKSFTAGESVVVKVAYISKSKRRAATSSFTVARPATPPPTIPVTAANAAGGSSFVSAPTIHPAHVRINKSSAQALNGYILLTPTTIPGSNLSVPGQIGTLIVDAHGSPVYSATVPTGDFAANLTVQSYLGKPVLTWWQGLYRNGTGVGTDQIVDSSYSRVAQVTGGNGYQADLHDFVITGSSGWITTYSPVTVDLSSVGGSKTGSMVDSIIQQIDIRTGLVMYEWHALGHVNFSNSYQPVTPSWDPYHVNSIARAPNGELLVSFRNTSAIYKVDYGTGDIIWTLGGKNSSFTLKPGLSFGFQHNARFVNNQSDVISLFDDHNAVKPTINSRGEIISLDLSSHTATLLREYKQPPLSAVSQGDTQVLSKGNVFIGWGSEPNFSEFSKSGTLMFSGEIVGGESSYRAFLQHWVGTPTYLPSVALRPAGSNTNVYASWNGATEVDSWRVLAGSQSSSLASVSTAKRNGFETLISTPSAPGPYFAVEALDSSGKVLARSTVVKQ